MFAAHPSFGLAAAHAPNRNARTDAHDGPRGGFGGRIGETHIHDNGVKLTKLSTEQAEYLGIPIDGPYKPDHYRY